MNGTVLAAGQFAASDAPHFLQPRRLLDRQHEALRRRRKLSEHTAALFLQMAKSQSEDLILWRMPVSM